MTPAFTSSSLYLPIAASSSSLGMIPASLFFVAFTITITFIAVSFRCGAVGRRSSFAGATSEAATDRHEVVRFFEPPSLSDKSSWKRVFTGHPYAPPASAPLDALRQSPRDAHEG